jgi:hypothetical protein
MGRPAGSQNKDKPFREALRMELAALDDDDHKSLRGLARNLLKIAAGDDGFQAIKEVADRLDGKSVQATEITGVDGGAIEITSDADRAKALAVFLAKTMPKE